MAQRAGINPRKLRAVKDQEQGLTLDESLVVAKALGPEAVNAILATIGYGGAYPLGEAPSLPEMGSHAARLSLLIHEATDPAGDGGAQITRREAARLRDWLLSTGSRCFAAAADLGRRIGS